MGDLEFKIIVLTFVRDWYAFEAERWSGKTKREIKDRVELVERFVKDLCGDESS